jgi:hypothetical protein
MIMAHDIKPKTNYSIVNVQLAIASTDSDEISDGLNELLRPEIGQGWIGDYEIHTLGQPRVVTSSSDPEEGEIFNIIE